MAVNGVGGTGSNTQVKEVDPDKIGFNGLTSETFLKLLITQLQNQDPTEPVGNEELLNQISTMRSLQSNIEMSEAIKEITDNQQITTGASFLGTIVTGKNAEGEEITGIADRVFVKDGETIVGMGEDEVAVKDIIGVSLGI